MRGKSSQTKGAADSDEIFVSYSTKDEDFAHALIERLKFAGYNVWYQDMIEIGDDYTAVLDDKLGSCVVGLVIWSRNSVENDNVISEAMAFKKRKCILPVKIEKCKTNRAFFSITQILECSTTRFVNEVEFRNILSVINKHIIRKNIINSETPKTENYMGKLVKAVYNSSNNLKINQISFGFFLGIGAYYSFNEHVKQKLLKTESALAQKLEADVKRKINHLSGEKTAAEFPGLRDEIAFVLENNSGSAWISTIAKQWMAHAELGEKVVRTYCLNMAYMKDQEDTFITVGVAANTEIKTELKTPPSPQNAMPAGENPKRFTDKFLDSCPEGAMRARRAFLTRETGTSK